ISKPFGASAFLSRAELRRRLSVSQQHSAPIKTTPFRGGFDWGGYARARLKSLNKKRRALQRGAKFSTLMKCGYRIS
ncbi:hypothetical protein, partial [Collinsella sp. CLA-AA-H302]|uniref:hypothetical protein n=1 Tax=Collinsella sp. CLA-AA-H302 TaxID=3136217 RepID=UPI0032C0E3AA